MTMLGRGALATLAMAAAVATVTAVAVDRFAPPPAADVGRGTEDAFVSGLEQRELPPRGKPLRWTTERASGRFVNLAPGPATVAVEMQSHRAPVRVAVDGAIVGVLQVGERSAQYGVTVGSSRKLEVTIAADAFRAGDGRALGTQWRRVEVVPAGRAWPAASLLAAFLLPALLVAAVALWLGTSALVGIAASAAVVALEAALLVPSGLVRSGYAWELAMLLGAAALVAGAFGRLAERWRTGAGRWGFLAGLTAFVLHCVLATSPVMIVNDVVYQSHVLDRVAGGDLFPTTPTQHVPPFQIPYGVSFFALLAPLRHLGLDGVALVRWGAGVAGLIASLALFGLLAPQGPRRAALVVLCLQLLPGTFLVYSQGNLGNAFGQAMTVLFFAWWAGSARGGWPVGAALFVVAALGHLSATFVIGAWAVGLAVLGWKDAQEQGRRRLIALAVGLAITAVYYFHFKSLVVEQVSRVLSAEGHGSGSAWTKVFTDQLRYAFWEWWGWPAMALAALGLPRLAEGRVDRALGAFWAAGAVLFVAAIVSPVEVRYLYGLTLPLAFAAVAGLGRLAAWGSAARALGGALALSQVVLCVAIIANRVFVHYR